MKYLFKIISVISITFILFVFLMYLTMMAAIKMDANPREIYMYQNNKEEIIEIR